MSLPWKRKQVLCNALRKSRAGSDEVEIEFFFNPNNLCNNKATSGPNFHSTPFPLLSPHIPFYFALQTSKSTTATRMFTNSMGYDQDHRPAKRPRDNGGESARPNLNLNAGLAMENMRMGMGMGMSATGDSLKNTREGQQQQQQQQQVSISPTTTTTVNRGRTDDKNNRKLSCKECRRQVLSFPDERILDLTMGLLLLTG